MDVAEILGYAQQLLQDMGLMPFLYATLTVMVSVTVVRWIIGRRD